MRFDRRIRFIRLNNTTGEIEYLDITPNYMDGWQLLAEDRTTPPTVWVDESVPKFKYMGGSK